MWKTKNKPNSLKPQEAHYFFTILKTGKKKELSDFAFMNAGNEGKFIAGLKKEIDAFLKL